MVEKEKPPCHISYDYYETGVNSIVSGEKVNEIIEEIMSILISKEITIELSIKILEDTISSVEKEAILNKRLIENRIT